jgi:REP element-mobilizing transposase RayT
MKFDSRIHQRHSIRLRDYDYSQTGGYFVTIVTYQRKCLFGQVVNGVMTFDESGVIAKQQWERLSRRFPNTEISEFIIMPNHIHGIIEILEESRRGTAEGLNGLISRSYRRAPTKEQFQKPIKGSIPTIIRSYKSAVTYRINLLRGSANMPVW